MKKFELPIDKLITVLIVVGTMAYIFSLENKLRYLEKEVKRNSVRKLNNLNIQNIKPSLIDIADNHISRSVDFAKIEDFENVIKEATKAIELEKNGVWGYNNRGYGYLRLNKLKLAERDLKKALDLDPFHQFALNNMGLLNIKQKQFDEALKYVRKAEKIDKTLPELYLNFGLVQAGKNNFEEAISEFNKSIELNHNLAIAYEERAKAFRKMGEKEKAKEDTIKSINIRREQTTNVN